MKERKLKLHVFSMMNGNTYIGIYSKRRMGKSLIELEKVKIVPTNEMILETRDRSEIYKENFLNKKFENGKDNLNTKIEFLYDIDGRYPKIESIGLNPRHIVTQHELYIIRVFYI